MRRVFVRLALLICVALAAPAVFASAPIIYITPNGGTQGNCTTNTQGPGFFNNAANWGTGANQIGPGTTVLFCGTFTDVVNGTLFRAQGSGAQGSPITLKFDTGTVWQSPAESTFLVLDNQSHFIVDGGTTCGWINLAVVSCNGHIQNTANGTNLTYQNYNVPAISAGNSSDIEIRNLEIGPLYIKVGVGDSLSGAPGPRCVVFGNGPNTTASGMYIHNNVMHDVGWCLNGSINNLTVANNEMYYLDHGLGFGINTDGASTLSGITVHDNHIHDTYVYDTNTNAFHHDGVHIFAYRLNNFDFNPTNIIKNINIYNNLFDGNWGSNNTAHIFFEGNIQNANIFNNLHIYSGQINNGSFNGNGTNINYFNNTSIGPGVSIQTIKYSIFLGPGFLIKNNVWTDGGMISTNKPFPNDCPGVNPCQQTSYILATNAYIAPADFGNGLGFCPPTPIGDQTGCNGFLNFSLSGFTTFETSTGEVGGIFSDGTPTSSFFNKANGQELTGAPTITKGTNLSSLCLKNGGSLPDALCSDIGGRSRPSSGAWDVGAWQFYVPPAAPGTVSVVVN